MAKIQKKEYSMDELKAHYQDITELYDYAGELVNTVESPLVKDAEQQLEIVEPLISEIGDATDILAEEFMLIAESQKRKTQSKASKSRVENALRKIYNAIHDYQKRAKDIGKKAMNIADPIVTKIQRQMEKVLAVFLEFLHISLHNIMGKAELEAVRVRNTRIAMLMHQMAMGQQQ